MLEPKEPNTLYEPKPPQKLWEIEQPFYLKFGVTYTVDELVNQLPAELNADAIRIKYGERHSGCDSYSEIQIYYVLTQINSEYDSELKEYNNAMIVYKEQLPIWEKKVKQYLEDLDEYIAWCKSENKHIYSWKYDRIRDKYRYLLT